MISARTGARLELSICRFSELIAKDFRGQLLRDLRPDSVELCIDVCSPELVRT